MRKVDVVAETLSEFPDHPNRTLARVLFAKYPTMFPNLENARNLIRLLRGSNGDKKRTHKHMAGQSHRKPLGWQASIPKSLTEKSEPVQLPFPAKVLLLSDIHAPYHDRKALTAALKEGVRRGATDVLLNGDTMDNYSWSRFEPDVRKRDPKQELAITKGVLESIRKAFPKARIWFKNGNHEDRIYAYLNKSAPVILQEGAYSIGQKLEFERLGIVEIGSRQLVKAGSLTILHGHEVSKSSYSPVSPARRLWNAFGSESIAGHWHQESVNHVSLGSPKKYVHTYTTGCLCELAPDYATINQWSHGFAFVALDKDGDHSVELITIVDGKIKP